jgi:prepilin-type N-terminal cleavage/methylation domain-containing protein
MTPGFSRPVRTDRGYTVIEVLMAMTVMAIGGAAVITMQKSSVVGNADARRADVANSIGRTWVERLERDSMQWTLPGPESAVNNIANALIVANVNTSPGVWFLPTQEMNMSGLVETMSPAFDILGRDLNQSLLSHADFCVNVRLTWLPPTQSAQDLIRADVRVLWPIGIANSLPGFCNPTTAALLDPNTDPGAKRAAGADPNQLVFHTLYVTTTLRENTSP